MITVGKLIEKLQSFPPDALAYAYEGEMTGVVVVGKNGVPLGEITASASGGDEDKMDTVVHAAKPK
jgi:hypothetical protein